MPRPSWISCARQFSRQILAISTHQETARFQVLSCLFRTMALMDDPPIIWRHIEHFIILITGLVLKRLSIKQFESTAIYGKEAFRSYD